MKIALVWYGRQGKKYVHYFSRHNRTLDIFTRSGTNGSWMMHGFDPLAYSLIIVAIYPITSQEIEIRKILQSGFSWYLLIEKPIAEDLVLLKTLVDRKKTIFFIDEAYTPHHTPDLSLDPIEVKVTSHFHDDKDNVCEHALGMWLMVSNFWDIISRMHVVFSQGAYWYSVSQCHQNILEYVHGVLKINNIHHQFWFDLILSTLLCHIQDEWYLMTIRKNYLLLRIHLL